MMPNYQPTKSDDINNIIQTIPTKINMRPSLLIKDPKKDLAANSCQDMVLTPRRTIDLNDEGIGRRKSTFCQHDLDESPNANHPPFGVGNISSVDAKSGGEAGLEDTTIRRRDAAIISQGLNDMLKNNSSVSSAVVVVQRQLSRSPPRAQEDGFTPKNGSYHSPKQEYGPIKLLTLTIPPPSSPRVLDVMTPENVSSSAFTALSPTSAARVKFAAIKRQNSSVGDMGVNDDILPGKKRALTKDELKTVAVFVPSLVLQLVMTKGHYEPCSFEIKEAIVVMIDLTGRTFRHAR